MAPHEHLEQVFKPVNLEAQKEPLLLHLPLREPRHEVRGLLQAPLQLLGLFLHDPQHPLNVRGHLGYVHTQGELQGYLQLP